MPKQTGFLHRVRVTKAAWNLADQALSSGTNFALTILVARSVSPDEFGAFAVAISIYLVCLTLGRSSISETVTLSLGRSGELLQGLAAAGLSATLWLAVVVGALIAGAAAVLHATSLGTILLVLALAVPGLLVQDYKRIVFFASGRPERAFVSDGLWALLQLGGVVIAGANGWGAPAVLLGIWGASALLSAALWPAATRGWWRHNGLRWLRRNRGVVAPLAGEGLLFQFGNQAAVFLLGAIAGLAQAGGYRAAQSLFGPVTVLVLGLRTAVLPALMRASRRSTDRALRGAAHVALAAGLFALVWGLALLALPDAAGRQILGPTWATAGALLWLVTIDRTVNGVGWGASLSLRILMRVKLTFLFRLFSSATAVTVSVVGASLAGAWGVAVGTAIAAPMLAVVAWTVALRARARALTGSVPGDRDEVAVDGSSGFQGRLSPPTLR